MSVSEKADWIGCTQKMKRENYITILSTIELLPLGILWKICPGLIESKYNFQDRHFATFQEVIDTS